MTWFLSMIERSHHWRLSCPPAFAKKWVVHLNIFNSLAFFCILQIFEKNLIGTDAEKRFGIIPCFKCAFGYLIHYIVYKIRFMAIVTQKSCQDGLLFAIFTKRF